MANEPEQTPTRPSESPVEFYLGQYIAAVGACGRSLEALRGRLHGVGPDELAGVALALRRTAAAQSLAHARMASVFEGLARELGATETVEIAVAPGPVKRRRNPAALILGVAALITALGTVLHEWWGRKP